MKLIRAYSDLHGRLPIIEKCDTLLLAGDLAGVEGDHNPHFQLNYIHGIFTDWCNYLLESVCHEIVMIPGNHDFWAEIPYKKEVKLPEGVTFLVDEGTDTLAGLSVYGSPWVPNLPRWAYYGAAHQLDLQAKSMPEGYDIWLMHGPPYMICDGVRPTGPHVGNGFINKAVRQKKPKYYICGHIHEAYGKDYLGHTNVLNVSFLDDMYEPKWRHGVIAIEEGQDPVGFMNMKDQDNPKQLFYHSGE